MARHEVQFPTNISYGSSGGPGHNTSYLESAGGASTRVGRWGSAVRSWNVTEGVKTKAQVRELYEFVIAREGGLHSFRFKDWSDFSTDDTRGATPDAAAFDDVVIGTGDGVTTDFQLLTKYTSGATTKTRTLQAPVSGTVRSGISGVSKAETTDWTVDLTTGIISYLVPPIAAATVTAGCDFDCVVYFAPGTDALLSISLDKCDIRSIPQIGVIEEPSTVPIDDEMHWGNGSELGFTIPTAISNLTARAWSLTPTAAATILLPSPTQQFAGGPHFFLYNAGAFTITVKTGTTTIGTIVAGATKTACVFVVGGVNVWRIF